MPITFATTGKLASPGFYVRPGGGLRSVPMPVACAIVERPEGLLLIDTGWSRAQCEAPDRDPGRALKWLLAMNVRPGDDLASSLSARGYAPGDVRDIVATHLHLDHVGGVCDFPKAKVHVSSVEWAQRSRGRMGGYDPRSLGFDDRAVVHALAGPPALGFPASEDLYGDGTVLLLAAYGHTLGSTAVAVKLDKGWLVHAGDACMFRADYADGRAPSLYARVQSHDLAAQRRTFACFRAAERDHAATVVPSHDQDAFESLPRERSRALRAAWDA
jgi:glyoxylase-like metal-dependent hydrolase (beta-lactamase superfamily II)